MVTHYSWSEVSNTNPTNFILWHSGKMLKFRKCFHSADIISKSGQACGILVCSQKCIVTTAAISEYTWSPTVKEKENWAKIMQVDVTTLYFPKVKQTHEQIGFGVFRI